MLWSSTVVVALVAALVLGTLARLCGLSPLLGYLLAGTLIGPHTPGFVGDAALAGQLADVGVILLMFGVGLEFSFPDLWAVRRQAVPGALLASGAVVALGAGLGALIGWPLAGGLVLGMGLATASTVVIVRGMTELGLLGAQPGKVAVGWSLVEDLITVVLLVVLPALAGAGPGTAGAEAPALWLLLLQSFGKVAALAVVVVVGGGRVVPLLLGLVARARSRELFTLAVVTLALGIAFAAAEAFGVSLALGAFLAGMVVGRSDLAHQAAADALPMRDAFAVLFFVAAGMLFDPGFVLREPGLLLAAMACVLVGKPLVAVGFLLWTGTSPRHALAVGAGLAQVSEFSFVLAGLATGLGVLPPGGRDLVVATAIASIAVSPLLFRGVPSLAVLLHRLAARHGRGDQAPLEMLEPAVARTLQEHVVLVGYGRVGSLLAEFLRARQVPFVVVEMDRAVVQRLRASGQPALFGDGSRPVLLDRAAVERARALVLTNPDPVAQRLAMWHARSVRPDLEVVARVHSGGELAALQSLPRTRPVHAERELGLAMAHQLLEALGSSPVEAEATVASAARGEGGLANPPRLYEIAVPPAGAVVGRRIADCNLPAGALVVAIVRAGRHLVARGPTELLAGDTLLLFASGEDAQSVERLVREPVVAGGA
ncbi:MAG: cation:proton antiporter [Planctomycetes bacterium]|nr:cation:proton antiporter [Planctomycetota bacterium]